MKKVFRLMTVVGVAACLFSLFGCRKKHIQDGPGMVNDLNWKSFSLSRSDSTAEYNFYFEVAGSDEGYLLTGECRSEGEMYCMEEGVRISAADLRYLRSLDLGNLPEITPHPSELEDVIILDAPTVTLQVTYPDGTTEEKAMGNDFSVELYQRFLPYFEKNHKKLRF